MTTWKRNGTSIEWFNGSIRMSLHETAPQRGIGVEVPAFATTPTLELFGTDLPKGSARIFVVQNAVSPCAPSIGVTFPEIESLPVEYQVDWRVMQTDAGHIGLDSVASARTQLLEAPSCLKRWSRVDAAEVLLLRDSGIEENPSWQNTAVSDVATPLETASACVLFRLKDPDLSYVEMVHPADHQSSEIHREAQTGKVVIRHTMLTCSLEKGVILRARMRGVILPRSDDESAAATCFARFLDADPPLGR